MIQRLAFAIVLLAFFQLSTQKTFPRLPREVMEYMGSREMRYHHFLWHNIREYWPQLNEETQQAIEALGWKPPRPSLIYNGPDDVGHANEENGSGEDFLYMHQQMVNKTNEILAKVGGKYNKVVGFKQFPPPNDTDYPVPCAYDVDQGYFTDLVAQYKSVEFYEKTIVPAEKEIRDVEVLRNMKLGKLGSILEYTLHKYMHLRFSKKTPYGFRPQVWNVVPNISTVWDDLSYQWLADAYSSHVNPVFWRIHGWVEDRLEDWRRANNYTTIPWTNPWVGADMDKLPDLIEVNSKSNLAARDNEGSNADGENSGSSRLLEEEENHMAHKSKQRMEKMEKVLEIFLKGSGFKESPLLKEVKVSPFKFEIEREKERQREKEKEL